VVDLRFKKTVLSILTIMFLLLVSAVCTANIEDVVVMNTPIKDRITVHEWAEYEISIENKNNETDTFLLTIAEEGVEFSSLAEPHSYLATGVELGPGEIKKFKYMLKPREDMGVNPNKPYKIRLTAESANTKKMGSTIVQLYIVEAPPTIIIYESDINVSHNIPAELDPRNIYSFKIDLINNNPKDIKKLKVALNSISINQEAEVELGSEVKKSVAFTVKFESIKPMQDALTITVTEDNRTLYKTVLPFEIVSYAISFKTDRRTEKSFLKKTEYITLTNNEVLESQQVVKIDAGSSDRYFTDTSPRAEIVKENGAKFYTWNVQLKPGESTTLEIESSYRILLLIFGGIAALAILAYVFRNPIGIIKEADNVISKDGGINEIKVIITIKNTSNKTFEKVKVLDKIPKIAGLEKRPGVGTLAPTKVNKRPDGTILQWDIDKIEGKEERILAYSFSSKLGIVGDMRLPPSIIILKKPDGNKKKIRSNELDITSPE
jgi:hypothetical protein